MDHLIGNSHCPYSFYPIKLISTVNIRNPSTVSAASSRRQQLPKNLRSPRRAKLPPEPVLYRQPINKREEDNKVKETSKEDAHSVGSSVSEWSPDELEAISALFERKLPQKRPISNKPKPRPLPLPLPYKTRPALVPTPKHHIRLAARSVLASRATVSDQVRKNPEALIGIARDIAALSPDSDVSEVLDGWAKFLRKGSLSMTVRELGHMGLPERALQTFLWAQKHQPELFPDDRTLASTVEVLARSGKLKMEFELEKFLNSASRVVLEAMARGFIRAGNLGRARRLLLIAKQNNRTLDTSVYVKLILEAGKNPDGYKLASALLNELAEREELDLRPQDCTAIMKVCVRLKRFEVVEGLFNWYKESGKDLTVVMYTTVIHSRYCEKKYREGLALIWEMERSNLILDLPAYRVIIRLCVALNDLERAARYFSRLKEAGFAPTYDIYRNMICVYGASQRLAKCRQICKEVEMAGFTLDKETVALLSGVEEAVSLGE
nr:pentatricopeptide repeat protein AaPPR317 [Agave angustifolia]